MMEGYDIGTMSTDDKINLILQKTLSNEINMANMKTELSNEISSMRDDLTKKIETVDKRVTTVQDSCNANTEEIKTANDELAILRDEVRTLKINEINNGVHSRRYNLVIGNLKDERGWETAGVSMMKVREFLRSINLKEFDESGYEVEDHWNPDAIIIKEAHRLPQDPSKFSFIKHTDASPRPRNRLMVIRLESYTDVGVILRKCKHLQSVNGNKPKHYKQFVDRHYPKCVQAQKDDLKTEFNKLRAEGKKPIYRYNIKTASMTVVPRNMHS